MRVITTTYWDCKWIYVYDYTLDDIRELQKRRVAFIWHISFVLHTMENTLIKSRNGLMPVLYDSPRIADDDRRER